MDGYTGALFMAFLTLSEAQLWTDEDRAAQVVANGPAVNVANGVAGEKCHAVLRGRRLGVFNAARGAAFNWRFPPQPPQVV